MLLFDIRPVGCAVQIDMDISAVAGSFNEGADSVQWQHHK